MDWIGTLIINDRSHQFTFIRHIFFQESIFEVVLIRVQGSHTEFIFQVCTALNEENFYAPPTCAGGFITPGGQRNMAARLGVAFPAAPAAVT
jgi:hypothetical protein